MDGLKSKEPHADSDPRRQPDPRRENIPEGLRRERKSAYGPHTGRRGEKADPEESRHAERRHIAEDK